MINNINQKYNSLKLTLIRGLTFVVLISFFRVSLAQTTHNKKPNILFITISDMNDWTTLFDERNPINTPNLKELAKRGVFFSQAYSVVPADTPSRAAVLSGFTPQRSGSYDNRDFFRDMMPDAISLPAYFRLHGYQSKGAGKIFSHFNGARGGDYAGKSFDDFQPMPYARKGYERDVGRGNQYNGSGVYPGLGPILQPEYDWGAHILKLVDIDMAEYVEGVIEEKWSKPMFLAAGIFKPHPPFYAPAETFEKYPIEELVVPPQPESDLDDVPTIGRRMAHRENFLLEIPKKQEPGSPLSYEKMVQSYQASADFADQIVGRLLDKLDDTGKTTNTIIVLWSDNGRHMGDKESASKFTLWEKANRVPFIIVAPGVGEPGTLIEQPVSLLDIYPTLVELAGLPPKEDADGQSLVPLMNNPEIDWELPAIMTMGEGNYAVRSKRWMYIQYRDGSEELYDHKTDPWEWKNLAGDSEYEEVKRDHKKLLQEYLSKPYK